MLASRASGGARAITGALADHLRAFDWPPIRRPRPTLTPFAIFTEQSQLSTSFQPSTNINLSTTKQSTNNNSSRCLVNVPLVAALLRLAPLPARLPPLLLPPSSVLPLPPPTPSNMLPRPRLLPSRLRKALVCSDRWPAPLRTFTLTSSLALRAASAQAARSADMIANSLQWCSNRLLRR